MVPGRRSVAPFLLAALVPAMLTGFAYWPGLMSWDPVHQYAQAVSGKLTDWHPPVMQWLWRRFIPVWPGPAPMLLLQLATWWGGLALLAARAGREKRTQLAWGLLGCGLLPLGLALTGAVFKDSLMAGALVAAAGLLAWRHSRLQWLAVPLALVLLVFAAALRFNGFVAAMPLLVMLLPEPARRTRTRLVIAGLLASAALLAVVPAINAAIGARRSGVELSLLLFDLGGITEFSGVDAFPPVLNQDLDGNPLGDPVAANHRCYDPEKWDTYSDWVDHECPLGFTGWNETVVPAGLDAKRVWLAAVLHHPLAYARHRLTHFAYNTRLVPVSDAIERPVPVATVENDWGFHITPNPVFAAIDALAVASAHTPLGWPIVMIALAFGALVASRAPARRGRRGIGALASPLAWSALLYGMSYLALSVASELRYHLWTSLAALLATALVAADARAIGTRRLALAFVPAVAVTLACIALRL